MDFLEHKVCSDFRHQLRRARPEWTFTNVDELREMHIGDSDILHACREIGLLKRSEFDLLRGDLKKRNLCAHPSDYFPGLNETRGYVDGLLRMIENLQGRKP